MPSVLPGPGTTSWDVGSPIKHLVGENVWAEVLTWEITQPLELRLHLADRASCGHLCPLFAFFSAKGMDSGFLQERIREEM